MKSRSIIITAGGLGKRMGADQPKQLLELLGKPILMYAIERLKLFSPDSQLILTLPESSISHWEELCVSYQFQVPHLIIAGGEERYHSVKNALAHCTGEIIAVHDGVRPLVSKATVERLFEAIENHTAVIPVVPIKESIRQVIGNETKATLRADYRIVQTPQLFHAHVLKKAYELPFSPDVTDDAGLVEISGETIHLVDGNEENIKITTPTDLVIAESFLRK